MAVRPPRTAPAATPAGAKAGTAAGEVKETQQSRLYQALFEDIANGRLRAGERLIIDDIAARFNVSKIPVREAIKALEGNGWLESIPRRGAYVRRVSMDELYELLELRMLLEPELAFLAAHRRRGTHLQQLASLIQEGEEAVSQDDFSTASRVNSRFHALIAQAAGNERAHAVVQDLELRLRRYFFVADAQERRDAVRQHTALYEAIRDQEAEQARELMRRHLQHTEAVAAQATQPYCD